MARNSRNRPATSGETSTPRVKKDPAIVRSEIVTRVRKMIRKSVARLQAQEMRTSGNPEGNFELLKAYKAFDKELENAASGKVSEPEVEAA